MLIDYKVQRTFDATLQLDDPGNCAILCHGEYREGHVAFPGDYYLIANTVMGKTTIIKWGPMIVDFDTLPNNFKLEIKVFGYKEQTIERELRLFINSPDKAIYEAIPILKETALEAIPNQENYKLTLS